MTSTELANVNQTDGSVMKPTIKLVNTARTCIQNLNEDCLQEIFSNKSLTLLDLCSLAETCKFFKRVIDERVFPTEFGIVTGYCKAERVYCFESKRYHHTFTDLRDVDRILKNFRHRLVTLSLRCHTNIVKLIGKYFCGDDDNATIKRLKVEHLGSIEGVRLRLGSIFQRVLELSILDVDFSCFSSSHFRCDSLTKLEIFNTTHTARLLQCTFPNLQQFTMLSGSVGLANNLVDFIKRHRGLRNLHTCWNAAASCIGLLNTIGNHCTELRELSLKGLYCPETSFDISSLQNLTELRRLNVDFQLSDCNRKRKAKGSQDYRIYIVLIEALRHIETLELCDLDEFPIKFFNFLPQLQNLRELRLIYFYVDSIPWSTLTQLRKVFLLSPEKGVSVQNLIVIIEHLTNLEELTLHQYFKKKLFDLSKADFDKIVKLVEQRPNVLSLYFKSYRYLSAHSYENGKVRLIKPKPYPEP